MRIPDSLGGLVLDGGRPAGVDIPPLAQRESLAPWREMVPRGPLLVQTPSAPLDVITEAGRLARLGEVWLDAPKAIPEMALDLLIAGAGRLVLWHGRAASQSFEAVGASAVVGWDGRTPIADAVAVAEVETVPLLCSITPPALEGLDAFVVRRGPEPWRLTVHRLAEREEPSDDGAA